jgi:hypothetical protein
VVGAIAGRRVDSTDWYGEAPTGLGSCRRRRQPFAERRSAARERKATRGVTRLAFLSPDECAPEVRLTSPLARAASDGAVTDVSALGKLEVRGDVDALEPEVGETLLPIGPGRSLLVTEGPTRAARERLAAAGLRVYDMTAALAALELEGEDLMRRLTELDLERLPAIGSIARGTPALIERREGERFRLFVPQELGHFVAEVVEDMARGLRL